MCAREIFCQPVQTPSMFTSKFTLLWWILKKTAHLFHWRTVSAHLRVPPVSCNLCTFHSALFFLPSVFLRCTVAFLCTKYQYFSMAALFKPALFLRYIFPPVSPISFPLLSGILQSTDCRFPQWPSLFPPVSLRDICGAHSMYVRPLNEKSILEFLSVWIQLREIFFFKK